MVASTSAETPIGVRAAANLEKELGFDPRLLVTVGEAAGLIGRGNVDDEDGRVALRNGGTGKSDGKRDKGAADKRSLHQNAVPTLKVMSLVSSPFCLSNALATSIRSGPNGEFQLTPIPTDRRGFQVSP